MNAPQQPPENNSPQADRTSPSERPIRRHIEIAKLLIPLVVLVVLIYLLRAVPDAVLREEFEGVGAAFCAVTYAVILMWRLSRIIAPKVPPPDVPDPEETSDLLQKDTSADSTVSTAIGANPVNPGA